MLILVILLINISSGFEIGKKEEIRRLFYFSVESTDSLKIFEKKLKSLSPKFDEVFSLAYNGAYLTLVAKHSINPYTKYYKLKEGLELLDSAIQKQPDNLEFRFIRLSILNYVPSFLGYDEIFLKDFEKTFALLQKKDFTSVDKLTQIGMIEFLMQSKKLNAHHKSTLEKLYLEFK
ncbi:MAG: hypothetical protein ACPL25_05145 [Ignavibacteria bacterium]